MATIPMSTQSFADCLPAVREAKTNCDANTYHRIAEVRSQQGLSLRAVARRTGVDVRDLKLQEQSNSNLTLAELYRWQEALDVPIENLLVDHDETLSE